MTRVRLMLTGTRGLVLLASLGMLAFVSAVATFSGGSMAATSVDTATLSTGAVSVTNPRDGSVLISADDLRPGDSESATVPLANGSRVTAPLNVTIASAGVTETPEGCGLADALRLAIVDVTGGSEVLWQGSASSLATAAVGTLAPGETRAVRLTLSLPESAVSPELQHARATLRLRIQEATP